MRDAGAGTGIGKALRSRLPPQKQLMHISAKLIREADAEGRLDELAAILASVHDQDLRRLDAQMRQCAGNPLNEALPLRDDGEDFGVFEANIPMALALDLERRPGFGPGYLKDPSGMKDFLKQHPECRVKTVSGKIQSGYGSKRLSRTRVIFGRNTMTFAS